jgi:hypothetical protein|nr:hypothetical protein [uncultured Flavobacterium sp.]
MTYEEAFNDKNSREIMFTSNGIKYVWMVVPKTEKYFEEYSKDCLTTSETFFDDTAIRYAKDGLFKVFGVKMLNQL